MNFNDLDEERYNKETFGKSIKERREELSLSLRKVAKYCSISAAYLSDIEKANRSAPTTSRNCDIMSRLIKILNIPEDQIESFYDMAYASRGYYEDLKHYVNDNKYVRLALNKAKEMNIDESFWKDIIIKLNGIKSEEEAKTMKLENSSENII